MEQYDVVVVGLGVMGAAAVWSAAKRGVRVLGVDARKAGHNLGSSHGKTRATRESYFESPEYVPLMKEAHDLCRVLEREAGSDLLTMNGGAYMGPPDHPVMAGVRHAAEEHGLPLEVYSPEEMMALHPGFVIPDGWQALIERSSGVLRAEACVKAFHDVARLAGADLRFGVSARSWRAVEDGVILDLASGPVKARKLILDMDRHGDAADYTHFAFSVSADSFDSMKKRIIDTGCREWSENRSEGASFYFCDPDGHQLEIHVGDIETRLNAMRANPWEEIEFFN